MAKYKYVANKNSWDETATVVVARDEQGNVTKELSLGGNPVDLTDSEYNSIAGAFELTKVSEESATVSKPVDNNVNNNAETAPAVKAKA